MPIPIPALSRRLAATSMHLARYGLVVIVLWLGVFKFTPTEARAIEPLLTHSPLLSWLYVVTDVRGASRLIGSAEIVIALLIALRPVAPLVSGLASLAAVGMFLTTLSFLVTTPGMWGVVDGVPVFLGGGGFVIKDVFLLAAALGAAAEALAAAGGPAGRPEAAA